MSLRKLTLVRLSQVNYASVTDEIRKIRSMSYVPLQTSLRNDLCNTYTDSSMIPRFSKEEGGGGREIFVFNLQTIQVKYCVWGGMCCFL